jgi:membrane protein involved in colicin uptake
VWERSRGGSSPLIRIVVTTGIRQAHRQITTFRRVQAGRRWRYSVQDVNWRREAKGELQSLPHERKLLAERYTIDAEEAERRAQHAEEQAARQAEAEEAARIEAEETARRVAAEKAAREAAEEAARRAAEEEAARRAAEEEAARRAAAEEAARQAAEEEAARRAAAEQEAKRVAEAAAMQAAAESARRAAEEEAQRRAVEQEAARRAAEPVVDAARRLVLASSFTAPPPPVEPVGGEEIEAERAPVESGEPPAPPTGELPIYRWFGNG